MTMKMKAVPLISSLMLKLFLLMILVVLESCMAWEIKS